MDMDVAPAMFHWSVAGCPAVITVGVIVKLEIAGAPMAVMLMVAVAVAD